MKVQNQTANIGERRKVFGKEKERIYKHLILQKKNLK